MGTAALRGASRAPLGILDDVTTSPASRRLASARPALAPKCQLILARTLSPGFLSLKRFIVTHTGEQPWGQRALLAARADSMPAKPRKPPLPPLSQRLPGPWA